MSSQHQSPTNMEKTMTDLADAEPTRIEPLAPPYSADVEQQLTAMMPPGVPPILLFRTVAKNLAMATAMRGWGGYELGSSLSLTLRDREILIDRTCARCGCEYEWGVHIAFFGERAELRPEQITSLTHGQATDPCWNEERDRLLIECADALHDNATLDDRLYRRVADRFDEAQILDILMLCGWYHAISFAANGAGVALENGAPRFGDVIEAERN